MILWRAGSSVSKGFFLVPDTAQDILQIKSGLDPKTMCPSTLHDEQDHFLLWWGDIIQYLWNSPTFPFHIMDPLKGLQRASLKRCFYHRTRWLKGPGPHLCSWKRDWSPIPSLIRWNYKTTGVKRKKNGNGALWSMEHKTWVKSHGLNKWNVEAVDVCFMTFM